MGHIVSPLSPPKRVSPTLRACVHSLTILQFISSPLTTPPSPFTGPPPPPPPPKTNALSKFIKTRENEITLC